MTGNIELEINSWKSEERVNLRIPSVNVRPEVIPLGH